MHRGGGGGAPRSEQGDIRFRGSTVSGRGCRGREEFEQSPTDAWEVPGDKGKNDQAERDEKFAPGNGTNRIGG